ncbi:hypothetical protein DPH57_16750 [Massilia sp. YMA4]|nr:hypothetical protein DPH57_16750 [Massilia sp. YMA4]
MPSARGRCRWQPPARRCRPPPTGPWRPCRTGAPWRCCRRRRSSAAVPGLRPRPARWPRPGCRRRRR